MRGQKVEGGWQMAFSPFASRLLPFALCHLYPEGTP